MSSDRQPSSIPWFGARKMARALVAEVGECRTQLEKVHAEIEKERAEAERGRVEVQQLRANLERLGGLTVIELENRKASLETDILDLTTRLEREQSQAAAEHRKALAQLQQVRTQIVTTEDLALLQEVGIYQYHHPLSDAVAYESALARLQDDVKAMTRKDGGAIRASTSWTVNGSVVQGRKMVGDFSKLMLRAFNAEADNLVRSLKPYKVDAAIVRLKKVAETIERLGRTMQIEISPAYLALRVRELELTGDFLQKKAEEKEAERAERERLREERKVQQEIERERVRLEKERQHYANALEALVLKGDEAGAAKLREQLEDVQHAIEDVDYRAANIRAGYVYVISNIGSFGEEMVKIGMTRRLDPKDRIRELSDASVPFNFDIHALFFANDAVGIETSLHTRLAERRVNLVNRRREFFRATPNEVKEFLAELAGELLEFEAVPEALEYRESLTLAHSRTA